MKRYSFVDTVDGIPADMEESSGGDFVHFDDIAQLERDYEATRAINVRLQQEVDELRAIVTGRDGSKV
jgi:hypothetical protein